MVLCRVESRSTKCLLKGWCMNSIIVAIGKDVFRSFIEFEKAHDTIDEHGMYQMLRLYGWIETVLCDVSVVV